MRLLAWVLGIGLLGCTHEPQARSVTGPDGSPMVHVSCGADQSACFALAGQSCPGGYNLFPIFDARDNNFLVRCQGGPPRPTQVLNAPLRVAPAPLMSPPERATPAATAWSAPSEATEAPLTRATTNDSALDWGY